MAVKSKQRLRVKVTPNEVQRGIARIQDDAQLDRRKLGKAMSAAIKVVSTGAGAHAVEKRQLIRLITKQSGLPSRYASLAITRLTAQGHLVMDSESGLFSTATHRNGQSAAAVPEERNVGHRISERR